jgi:Glycosyl hydrolase family 115/Gylcosyl hydrolase family 115 C-terminal domain
MRITRRRARVVWFLLVVLCLPGLPRNCQALGQPRYIETVRRPGSFALAQGGVLAAIYVEADDYAGVVRAATNLQADLGRVTGHTPILVHEDSSLRKRLGANAIIVGTVGKSRIIDQLIAEHKIDATPIAGKWESFLIQVVPQPLPGVASGLIIAGSDKRGTIYGIYDLSEQIGVSPWYWWADVPIEHREALFIRAGSYVEGPPAVKYRGIFLNDEAPALSGWAAEKYGNLNHRFYEKVFELLLRLKANYLWPAMWNNAFDEDDPLNAKLADEYGIVMGTSHHEPMMRAWKEWKLHGKGAWDYSTNGEELRNFWQEGIERNDHYDSVVTIGMRGNGDEPMVAGSDAAANIGLLETIVAEQRRILGEVGHTDPSTVPQDWALYKEVQDYYEKGMRVPDDVTLLWSDDNWGNVRRLPTADERKRSGGAGIYYHFDYVGDPRSYKWLNTVPISKVWEQMNLAHQYGANQIWIANVGDLKPMEFPIEFFLDLGRDPQRWPQEKISEFARLWAKREFGPQYAPAIADIVSKYTKFNGRRKPELLEPGTFSLVDYQEADRVAKEWKSITDKAERIYDALPENRRDAFFELVLYPAKASAQVAELYIAVGRNRLYARQGRASTNDIGARARALFQADASLSSYYNHTLAHGKWDHMMDQTHIGYTSWRDPPANVMPKVDEIELPVRGALGIAIEGSSEAWPGPPGMPVLPQLDAFNRQRRYIDVFNRGRTSYPFQAKSSASWILLSRTSGTVGEQQRLLVGVNWSKAPKGENTGFVKISGAGDEVTVQVEALNPETPRPSSLRGFVEANGYVSIEAEHYTNKVDAGPIRWEKISDYGRTLSSMTVIPVTAESVVPPENSPHLEYQMYLFDHGSVEVEAILAPTLNFVPGRGLRYGVSFDNQPPQIIDALAHNSPSDWAKSVEDNARQLRSSFALQEPGYHTLKFWMVDPGVVLEKLVVDLGGVKPSYLGPPESYSAWSPQSQAP